jgi:hypothetical protein
VELVKILVVHVMDGQLSMAVLRELIAMLFVVLVA